ncbi:MAG: anti-sigma factor [Anaerolineae bacterium]|jgi:hypothetical protein|nr:anti-sigma factor [Anaerolineae bacterium]
MTTLTLTCADIVRYLSDYLEDNLADDVARAARDHIATCDNCRIVLDSTQQMILLYRDHGRAQRLPLARQTELFGRLAAAFSERRPPGQG